MWRRESCRHCSSTADAGNYWGHFDPAQHTAADILDWLPERIDRKITFWKLVSDAVANVFPNLDLRFRAMA